MIIDHKTPDYYDVKTRLYEIVVVSKISSLEMISEHTGVDEDSTRELLQELVKDGSIGGSFSEDGKRFFLSNVKISEAPVIMRYDKDLEIERVNTKTAKMVGVLGLFILVIGWAFQSLTGIHQGLQTAGIALFMVGIVVMTAGCIQFSRYNPPEKLR